MIITRKSNKSIIIKKKNDSLVLEDEFKLTKKQSRGLNLFNLAFCLYNLGYVISFIVPEKMIANVGQLSQAVQITGLCLMLIATFNLIKFKFDNKYLKTVYSIYNLYIVTIILRIPKFDYDATKTIFFNADFTVLLYFLPLMIFFPRNLVLYKKIFTFLIAYGILSVFFTNLFSNELFDPTWKDNNIGQYVIECIFLYLSYPLTFFLVTYMYHKPKINLFAFAVTLLTTYFLIFRARRGSLFMCATTLIGVLIVYLIYTKRTILVAFLSVFLILFSSIFLSGIKLPHMFDFLMARKDEDTRSYVEVAMKADMKPIDWLIGRGLNGTYFCPGINPKSDQRNIIETGYLQIILQGGIISISLLGLIILPAVYLGLFKSTNMLSKGAAIFIILWIVYQYPRIVTSFDMYYMLIWICVGICYSPKIRNLSDSVIKQYIR